MAYSLEGKDLVISGFENGIADSPHSGISDMRNVDPTTIPGEVSVAFATQNPQPVVTGAVFTADAGTDFLTWSGVASNGTVGDRLAITVSNSGGALPAGLLANTTYYVRNSTATTFQVSLKPGSTVINITDAGTGTQTFTTINIGRPTYSCSGRIPNNFVDIYYFMIDLNNRAWYWGGTFWVFLNNAAGSTFKGCGIVFAYGYLFVFHDSVIDYLHVDLPASTNSWVTNWQTIASSSVHEAILGSTDDVVYFCNTSTIGSFFQVAGKTFDPTDVTTYEYTQTALNLPISEFAQCISQLQTSVLVGGQGNVAYLWDRISVGYTPIFIGDNGISKIVCVDTNAYLFTGIRGRIYLTNGSQAQEFKKIPDHLSNTVSPLFTWGGAGYSRGQLYFGISATDASGTDINQYGGLWAIDLKTGAMRISNELSYGNYSGKPTTILSIAGSGVSQGYGLFIGWMDTLGGETDGIDTAISTPYTGGQSYVDSDLIPIGDFYNQISPSQIEWKTTNPLVSGESVSLYYRLQFSDAYTLIGTSNTVGVFSEAFPANFQKAQWLQIRAVLTGTASSPSYVRLKELRLKNYAQ